MKVCTQHERLVRMLRESITMMCKNALTYDIELNIEGLLGVTLDKRDIFLININESFTHADEAETLQDADQLNTEGIPIVPSSKRKRRARKSSRESTDPSDGEGENNKVLFLETEEGSTSLISAGNRHPSSVEDPQFPGEPPDPDLDHALIKEELDPAARQQFANEAVNQPQFPSMVIAGPSGMDPIERPQRETSSKMRRRHAKPRPVAITHSWESDTEEELPTTYFECNMCDETFANIADLEQHQLTHDDQLWVCDQCDVTFWSKLDLDEHVNVTHASCGHLCDLCNKVFPNNGALLLHKQEHIAEARTAADLEEELDSAELMENFADSDPFPVRYQCKICRKTFKAESSRDNHERSCGVEKNFMCEQCGGRKFLTRKGLRDHILGVHQHNNKRYKCPNCSMRFPYRSSVARHKRSCFPSEREVCTSNVK